MKKSIFIASFILLLVVGWIGSGQFTNVNAQDDTSVSLSGSEENNTKEAIVEDSGSKVEVKEFNFSQIDQSIELQGQTTHNKKIDVKSETTGNITNISFNRGDKVSKGDNLITISIENRNELLNSAKKDLERLNKELELNEKNKINRLSQNKELIKLYEIEFASAKQLIDKGLSSKSKLSLASFNLANARADQEDIMINFESQQSSIEAQIASFKSQLKNIELDIQNTLINAPFSGIISDKMIEESEYITPGNTLFTIIDLNPIKIQGYLSEFDVNKINLGTKAVIENTNGIKKIGKISFISPSAETSTRTFEITIEADNGDISFKSGITTKITIAGSELKAHKIPPSILTLLDDGTVGVKAINNESIVVFYPTTSVKDTIDGIWVSGLPDTVNLIITGQEYVSVGESISN
ncbi:MAG: efflux RND transporter periplasmic adaptor subunit [Pelagibacteraceae bacterium]|jgi:multidrug efflux system membrane fusion protein|nr:efflux RND transporter periplasmic adaptor subunit [Pelagibacteraceae bacterium]MBT4646301.1 efflux RND transporter periplasmic adaptor subunit [Pelagibacteraceae bacterium]MBT5214007.1 efflux RND transporter periplasmic adaptor subunit [Pelagibacteraceae bacterium]MBT6197814.1 efflux RND transporter periplasmic adaptor subunit [Pelagibacteraceae bacterium]MBT6353572.1 efflux RND transporter periplasmic adaptor subunit [Pelagibacteraceae bacterium]